MLLLPLSLLLLSLLLLLLLLLHALLVLGYLGASCSGAIPGLAHCLQQLILCQPFSCLSLPHRCQHCRGGGWAERGGPPDRSLL